MLESDIAKLIGLSAPILCLDTCSLLDVMRDPTRNSVFPHEVQSVLHLLNAMENKKDLVGLLAEQVRLEFNSNVDIVEQDTDKALINLQIKIERVNEVVSAFGAKGTTNLVHLKAHASRARAVAYRWIAGATETLQSPDMPTKALARLNQARTPARRGKDSMKDCVVIETYLDAVQKLRNAGLTTKIVFASSNTKDYAGEIGHQLKPDLAGEFAALNMEYASNGCATFFL